MDDDAQVMRLPRYARGLQIARFGVFGMLLMLGFSIALVIKSITASTESDAMDVFDYLKYTQWANLASVAAMLVGVLMAVPDFRAAKMSLTRLVVAVLCFVVTLLVVWWSYRAIAGFIEAALEGDLDGLEENAKSLASLPWLTVLKDIAYTLGLVMIVRSIRQTAVANDHYALRDAASTVSGLVAGMLAADVIYQLMYGMGRAGVTFALLGLVFSIGVFVYWVYCHLRLAKFLNAASILVHEPHNLPVARLVSTPAETKAPRTSGAIAKSPAARPSGPNIRASGPIRTSAPIVPTSFGVGANASADSSSSPMGTRSPSVVAADAVTQPSGPVAAPPVSGPVIPVAAELRHAAAPRATTAPAVPGTAEADGPKFLK